MKEFKDVDSPTLNKMEANNGGRFGRGTRKFSIGNIIGDPFSLATIGIAVVSTAAWHGHCNGNRLTCRRAAGS